MVLFTTFVNGRICSGSELNEGQMVASPETGLVLKRTGYIGGEIVDLEDNIVAPGFLELQTNGMLGFHFTNFENTSQYQTELHKVAKYLVTKGVTGFWVTIPTVRKELYHQILAELRPRTFEGGARLLGAHVEGPYLQASKKGAHNETLFQKPDQTSPEEVYGEDNLRSSVKLVTLAPELAGSDKLIERLTKTYGIQVSLGHSAATYEEGVKAMSHGATCLTHLFNAMNPLHHRQPGLAGLISNSEHPPHYSLIADGVHLHPSTLALAYRANPQKSILITDSIEMAGLPDGTYPGHAQIPYKQTKVGNKVVIENTDTLIGSCISMDECVRNLMKWTGCSIAQAVACATENIADMMRSRDIGRLNEGCYADFVVLDDDGKLLETWVGGHKVWGYEG